MVCRPVVDGFGPPCTYIPQAGAMGAVGCDEAPIPQTYILASFTLRLPFFGIIGGINAIPSHGGLII